MPVESSTSRAQYATNATTGPWTVPFYFLADGDLSVTYTDSSGVDTLLTLNSHYTVVGAGDPDGGTVTTVTAYPSGGWITLERDVDATQETEFVDGDSMPAAAVNAALDKLTMLVQQLNDALARSLTFPPSYAGDATLGDASERASKLLGFDADGNLAYAGPTSGSASDLALQLAANSGSGLVGVIQDGTGAVSRTVEDEVKSVIRVRQFAGDATITSAHVQAAINEAAIRGGAFVQFPFGEDVSLLSTVYVPTGVRVDLNGCDIFGAGIGSGTIFESGYLSGSSVITNVGTSLNTHHVVNAGIMNGSIWNCEKAVNLYNCNENFYLEHLRIFDCTYSVYADNVFYANFIDINSRNSAGGATNAAITFVNNINAITFDGIHVGNRVLGIQFGGGVHGCRLNNISVETGTNGILFNGAVHGCTGGGWYFETLTGRPIEFSGVGSGFVGCKLEGMWFNNCSGDETIHVENATQCVVDGRTLMVNSGTNVINMSDTDNRSFLELPIDQYSSNKTNPGLPAGWSINAGSIARGYTTLIDGGGVVKIKSNNFGGGISPRDYFGDVGVPVTGTVSFCQAPTKSVGDPYEIYLDTNHVTRAQGKWHYCISVTDTTTTYTLSGVIFCKAGGTFVVKKEDSETPAVTCTDNAGKLTLTLGAGMAFTGATIGTVTGRVWAA